ncbi:MAG: beta-ketoacyl synthase N-terminal-like domain-containing protein [Bacillus sp. (in: firmicutes)]
MDTVITGMGIIGPGFTNSNHYKEILTAGTCMLKQEYLVEKYLYLGRVHQKEIKQKQRRDKKHPKSVQMLLHACNEAVHAAKINLKDYRVAVLIGSSGGVISEVSTYTKELDKKKRLSPFAIGNMNANSLSTSVNAAYGLNGMSFSLSNSCTSGLDALHLANILIQSNQVDVCIVGASDATLFETVLKGFLPLKVLQESSQEQEMHGPFSGGKGFCMSEGAGVLIIEKAEIAIRRHATILGVIEATSITQDAISPYQSDINGNALLQAVDACIRKGMPTYINSQALGISENDDIEASIYKKRFASFHLPITSIKGMVGHAMGASTIFQIIASLISLKEQFIPPTIRAKTTAYANLLINDHILRQKINSVLITSHGYGGNNGCTLISKGGA